MTSTGDAVATGLVASLAHPGGNVIGLGQKVGRGPKADPGESPTADIVNEFLNEKDGQTWQSVPAQRSTSCATGPRCL